MLHLQTPLSSALKTTPRHLKKLSEWGINSIEDLLWYLPRAVQHMPVARVFADIILEQKLQLVGTLTHIRAEKTRSYKMLYKAQLTLADGAKLSVLWFRSPYQLRTMPEGTVVTLRGEVKHEPGRGYTCLNPELHLGQKDLRTLRAVYPESPPITNKWLREKLRTLVPMALNVPALLPEHVQTQHHLMPTGQALLTLHQPENEEEWNHARRSLGIEELLQIQLRVVHARAHRRHNTTTAKPIAVDVEKLTQDQSELPYTLTGDQQKTLDEVLSDIQKTAPMSRLLQGDVGAGKTVVALLAARCVMHAGAQTVLMAPTEILATQHYKNATKLWRDLWRIELLTGSTPAKEKKRIKDALAAGMVDLVIGTHAVITDDVTFQNLGLAIIDEQHRFGVRQRNKLLAGGTHMLNMTATPIPRTLALTLYGDQELSIIREKPPGRTAIITKLITEREDVFWLQQFLLDQTAKGRQVFWICPLVEASEAIDAKAVTEQHVKVQAAFPDLRVGLLHGQMKPADKEQMMSDFSDHKVDVLVSTSVVEVGVDVPNASMMIIENSERFGLSQLHQFRGRVGRGRAQSYCFLRVGKPQDGQKRRLQALVESEDGFYLSEVDLRLRGAGEIYGTRQSGLPDLKCADLSDIHSLETARGIAEELINTSPNLDAYPQLRQFLGQTEVFHS